MSRRSTNRILMLLENYAYPADGRVRDEAHALAAAGYRVSVIAPIHRKQSRYEILDGITVYRFPPARSGTGLWGYFWEYGYSLIAMFLVSLRALTAGGFDVVHAAQPPDALALIAGFYKLLGKKYVLDHHDLSPELYYYARFRRKGNAFVYRALLWMEKLAFSLADHVITTNESYKEIAINRGHVEEDHITIVRNGPRKLDSPRVHAEPLIRKDGRLVIGYMGVTARQDGVDNLLGAVRHLVVDLKRSDFLCVVVGDGSAMPELKSLASELNIDSYVQFTGWVRDAGLLEQYLAEMDLCVAPEPSDPYNDRSTAVKVMEYMAAGRPIVSFDLPEHRLTARDAALYAKPGDQLELARQIAVLMDDPQLRERLGAAGRSRVESELGWPHQATRLLEAYAALAGPHPKVIIQPG